MFIFKGVKPHMRHKTLRLPLVFKRRQHPTIMLSGAAVWLMLMTILGAIAVDVSTSNAQSMAGFDYGDVPVNGEGRRLLQSPDPARHLIVPEYFLGNSVDGEANWNGITDSDTDDGIQFPDDLLPGETITISVTASVGSGVNVPQDYLGRLNGWIDFSGDGDFNDANEQVFDDLVLTGPFPQQLNITIPENAASGTIVSRFRYSTQTGLTPFGTAYNGEVEDYVLTIQSLGPLGPGYYQQDEPAIRYSGSWITENSNPDASGGSYIYSSDPNATASVSFYGTSLTVIGNHGSGRDQIGICIDNSCNTYNINGSGFSEQQRITVDGLSEGEHELRIYNPGSQIIDIDALEVGFTASTVLSPGYYEDDNPAFEYVGEWYTNFTNPDTSRGAYTYSIDPNGAVAIRFLGTGVTVIGNHTSTRDEIGICIDSDCNSYDINQSGFNEQQGIAFNNLTAGEHDLLIYNPGTAIIDIDAIAIQGVNDTVLGLGYYEEDNAAIDYYGTWYTNRSNPDTSDGAYAYSIDSTASATLHFEGSSLSFISNHASNRGEIGLCIDGICNTYNINRSGFVEQQRITIRGLTSGSHTLLVYNPGDQIIDIDAIEVSNNSPVLEPGYYEEDNEAINYIGAWYTNSSNPDTSNGTYIYSIDPNAEAITRFNGTSISVIGNHASNRGQIGICVDDVCNTYNINRSGFVEQQRIIISGLEAGIHELRIYNPGSQIIDIDALEVNDGTNVLAPGYYEEDNEAINYIGAWYTNSSNPDTSGGTYIYSIDPNAEATVRFEGRSVSVIGNQASNRGQIGICVDDVCNTYNINRSGFVEQQRITISGLEAGIHELRIYNPGSQIIDIDALEIFATTAPSILNADTLIPGFYEAEGSEINRQGSWTLNTTASASQGLYVVNDDQNDVLEFEFYGTGVELFYITGPTSGTIVIEIDGEIRRTVITDAGESSQKVTGINYLEPGLHQVRISSATDVGISIDALRILE